MFGAQAVSAGVAAPRDLLFVSYSHADKQWLEKILKFLKPYFPADRLVVWSDRAIHPGCKWQGAVDDALARTRLAVLLVSPDFLVSAFILERELPAFLAADQRREYVLLPILLTACPYRRSVIGHYQFLHDTKTPLDRMPKPQRNAELVSICDKIDEQA